MEKADFKGVKLTLPSDIVIADKFDNEANVSLTPLTPMINPSGLIGMYNYNNYGDEI